MLQIHTTLQNRYRILRQLGQGGFSTVYLAEDLRLPGRQVAIKENLDTTPVAARAFRQEAHLLARLQHEHLPRVTDHFVEPSGYQYLVMDYVEGEDLDSLIKRQGPLDEATALDIMRQVMSAITYLHSQQPSIIHRDIKPANLIRRRSDGQVVLVDFGIAKQQAAGGGTLTGARAATPGYAPPEQYYGRTDQRSDVYALGATLYFLLTGLVPPEAAARAAGYETLILPSQINPRISVDTEQVIWRAMDMDAGRRWQTVADMVAALLTGPVAAASPASRSSRTTSGRIAAAGGLILVTLALAGLLAWRPWPPTAGLSAAETAAAAATGAIIQVAADLPTTVSATRPAIDLPETAPLVVVTRTSQPIPVEPTPSTATIVPTSTPLPPAPTTTPTPIPTGTPTPLPVPQMRMFSLVGIANASSEEGYTDPPLGQLTLGGVPFDLPAGRNSVTTQAEPLPDNPIRVSLPLQVAGPQRVHLLLSGGDLFARYANKPVGVVRLRFASGAAQEEWLVAGYNLREWKIFDQATVASTTAGNVQEVWRSESLQGGRGIIDMLTIDVAPDHRTSTLVAVEIEDTSTSSVGSLDPAINWLGLTVVGLEQSAVVPTATPCVVTGVFGNIWASRQERLGCATGPVETATFTIQPFERGYLIWSKRTDRIYVLPEGGAWSRHANTWRPDEDPFSCDAARIYGYPVMGFGKLWCSDAAINQALGAPLDQERPDDTGKFQAFEKGSIVRGYEGRTFVLYEDNTWDYGS